MSSSTREFLGDLIHQVEPFLGSITHIFVKRVGNLPVFSAISTDRTFFLSATPKKDIPEFVGEACLGGLGYLRSILRTPVIKDGGKLSFNNGAAKNGIDILRTIEFSAKRLAITYRATDPSIPNLPKSEGAKAVNWPIRFSMTPDSISEFDTATQVYSATDDKRTTFSIHHADGSIIAMFGTGEKDANKLRLVLADSVAIDQDGEKMGELNLDIEHFRRVLKLCKSDGCRVQYSAGSELKAMAGTAIEFQTPLCAYTFILKRKIVK